MMAIGPQGPRLKSDGPACRVCGCTENNACLIDVGTGYSKNMRRPVKMRIGCSWVKVEGSTEPLCSACSGTAADMVEAIGRGCRMLQHHTTAGINMAVTIGKAARARYRARARREGIRNA